MIDSPSLIERLRECIAYERTLSAPAEGSIAAMEDAIEALSLTVSPLPEEIAGLLALKEGLPEGPWFYRPHKIDDWGWVRGKPPEGWPLGPIIACARAGQDYGDADLDRYRENGTDPYGPVAKAIAALPSLFAALERLTRENAHLEKVIAARDEQLMAEIRATGNFAKENERLTRENGRALNLAQEQGDARAILARENELLKYEQQTERTLAEMLRQRIRELKAERDKAWADYLPLNQRLGNALDECAAIEAKTIEKIAAFVDCLSDHNSTAMVAKAIRTLNQSHDTLVDNPAPPS